MGGKNSNVDFITRLNNTVGYWYKGYSVKGPEIGRTMEEIAEIARQMIVETESNPPNSSVNPGFLGSFWLYPRGAALA